jgi:hydrogenase maturation protease
MTTRQVNRRDGTGGTARQEILVLGVGNILLSDEGIGVRVVEALEEEALPESVELLDGGTAAADLLDRLEGRRKIIIIDAVRGGGRPGDVYRFAPADVGGSDQMQTSVHQVGLLEALAMAEYLGETPRNVVIYGVEPASLGWGLELSPAAAAVLPRVVGLVLEEIGE